MHGEATGLVLVGRRSSLFTRVPLMFAVALQVPLRLEPVMDMRERSADAYGGNPALKLPTLRVGGRALFGAQNICRCIASCAPVAQSSRIVWPEALRDPVAMNAQEMLAHAMAAQVQLVMGVQVCGLPAENVFFAKARTGLEGALQWLDANLDAVLAALPQARLLSLFEVSLFCLLEHLRFRATVPMDGLARLRQFVDDYGRKPAARLTEYCFDPGAR